MSTYILRNDPLEHLSDRELVARLLGIDASQAEALLLTGWRDANRTNNGLFMSTYTLSLALEIGRRLPWPIPPPTHIHSPVDLAALLLPLPGGFSQAATIIIPLSPEHRVLGMTLLPPHTPLAAAVTTTNQQHAPVVALAAVREAGEPHPTRAERAQIEGFLAGSQQASVTILDILMIAGLRWASLREQQPQLWTA